MYFANKGNPSYAGIARISCSDGSLQTYLTSTNFTIIGNLLNLEISDSGNTIYFFGFVLNSGSNNFCIWGTSTANFQCSPNGSSSYAISLYSNSDDWIYGLYELSQNYNPIVINPITNSVIWAKFIN